MAKLKKISKKTSPKLHKSHKEEKHIVHKEHKAEKPSMYFRLKSPLDVRREVLISAIDVTQLLRKYEGFKGLRHLRTEIYQDFNKVYHDLEILIKKLRTEDIPVIEGIQKDLKKAKAAEDKMLHMERQEYKHPVKEEKKEEDIHVSPRFTEDDRLERDLRNIQERLNRLNSER